MVHDVLPGDPAAAALPVAAARQLSVRAALAEGNPAGARGRGSLHSGDPLPRISDQSPSSRRAARRSPTGAPMSLKSTLIVACIAVLSLAAGHPGEAHVALPAVQQEPTSYALIDQALAAGRIDEETAFKYRVFAAFGDERLPRSEERRVGKECRSWWSPHQ